MMLRVRTAEEYKTVILRYIGALGVLMIPFTQILFSSSVLYRSISMLRNTYIGVLSSVISICCMGLFICGDIKHLRRGQFALVVVSISVLALSAIRTGDYNFLQCYLAILVVASLRMRRLAKAFFGMNVCLVITVILLSVGGLIEMVDFTRGQGSVTFAYGFVHKNTLAGFLLNIVCIECYLLHGNRKWYASVAFACAVGIFARFVLDAVAVAILCIFVGLMVPVSRLLLAKGMSWENTTFLRIVLMAVPALCFLLMLLCTVEYNSDNPLCIVLNRVTNLRPFHSAEYLEKSGGLTIFGAEYLAPTNYHSGTSPVTVDSAYSRLTLVNGLASALVLYVTYCLSLPRILKDEPLFIVVVILLLEFAYMFIELCPLYVSFNFFFLLLAKSYAQANGGH